MNFCYKEYHISKINETIFEFLYDFIIYTAEIKTWLASIFKNLNNEKYLQNLKAIKLLCKHLRKKKLKEDFFFCLAACLLLLVPFLSFCRFKTRFSSHFSSDWRPCFNISCKAGLMWLIQFYFKPENFLILPSLKIYIYIFPTGYITGLAEHFLLIFSI